MNFFKTYKNEILSLVLQTVVYYIYPAFFNPGVPLDLIVYSSVCFCIICFFNALFSKSKLRFWYPFAVLPLFVPAAFLFAKGYVIMFFSAYLAAGYVGAGIVALPVRFGRFIKAKFENLTKKK